MGMDVSNSSCGMDSKSAAPRPPRLSHIGLLVLAGAILAGCGESSTEPDTRTLTLQRVSGDAQTATVGTQLAQPLVVRAVDPDGIPVSGREIQFSVVSGGGSVSPSEATTNADGQVSVSWTLGTAAGASQILRASLAGDAQVEFTATALPGPAAQIQKVSGDLQIAQRGLPLREPLVVRVSDEYGNAVAGAPVLFQVMAGDGAVDPAQAQSDDQGRASTMWTLGPGLGEQSVSAGLAAAPSVDFSATALELPYIGTLLETVAVGSRRTDSPVLGDPGTDSGAPSLSASGIERIVNGGGGFFEVVSSEPLSRLYVFVEGFDGHHVLDLPVGQGTGGQFVYEVITTFGPETDLEEFRMEFAAGTEQGAGPREGVVLEIYPVNTGPIQVSVAWNQPSDLDLYVVEPSGETIYFDHPQSSTGGILDLDANGGCIGEDIRNENISWPEDPPLRGTYTVRLNLWSSCQQEETDWLVTIRVEGQATQTFRGRFTGQGDGGDENSGEFVAQFGF